MKILTSKVVVVRRDWAEYDADHLIESGYCAEQGTTQYLVKRWYLFGRQIWHLVLDSEEIPDFVVITHACFGDSYGTNWHSKFESYMLKGINCNG